MKPWSRFVVSLLTLFTLVAAGTAVVTDDAIAVHCENDECQGLQCKDAGGERTNCSITPGGSCVTSSCDGGDTD